MSGRGRPSLALVITLLVVISIGYTFVYRPWFLYWGATDEEILESYPGDRIVAGPKGITVRGTTVDALPGDVWPWLVQMGQDRAGFYSYDWLENLFGLDIHSTGRIIHRWQDLEVGDMVRAHEGGGFVVIGLEPEESLVLYANSGTMKSLPAAADGTVGRGIADFVNVWGFYIRKVGEEKTRLVVRTWSNWNPGIVGFLAYRLLMEPVHFLMERKMMRGIRERAEALVEERARKESSRVLQSFLPAYEFDEYHSIVVASTPGRVFDALRWVTLGEVSPVARLLLRVRNLPERLHGGDGGFSEGRPLWGQMLERGFVLLGESQGQELVFGWIGQPWRLSGGEGIEIASAAEFLEFDKPGYAKIAVNVSVRRIGPGLLEVGTETRIHVPDSESRDKFAAYWWFVQRGSGFIRAAALKAIRERAEAG